MAAVKRKRRLAVILTTLGVLLLGCAFGGYRYLDSRSRWAPWVDIEALRARAAQEQPVGGGEGETVAFLRSLGFEDRNIRIQHFAATDPRAGRLFVILGWIPQREGLYSLTQVRAYCNFDAANRLEECSITRGVPLEPNTSPNIIETTSVAAP